MITSVKDRQMLTFMLNKLEETGDAYICTLCGETMNIHPQKMSEVSFRSEITYPSALYSFKLTEYNMPKISMTLCRYSI
jgi:predicted transcriptional regulator of viral defense system